ncbi:MAG TPA: EamA family transporter [Cyanothece sp. UBA12306]|nr:EamA family transporter [Cyanothece sp. UBA12306]
MRSPSSWQVGFILSLGVLAISLSAIFIRLSINVAGTPGFEFSLFLGSSRLIVAAFLLLPAWHNFHDKLVPPDAYYYAMGSGLALACHFATWISSLSFTSIAASTTLVTTTPVWVSLISRIWFQEKLTKTTVIGIIIALIGGISIAVGDIQGTDQASNPILGNSLAFLGAVMASLYLVWGQQAQIKGLTVKRYIALVYTLGALLLFPFPFIMGSGYLGYPKSVYFYVLLMAVFPQLFGHTSFNWAVRWISPTLVTLAILFEPVGSSFLGFILFGEVPSLSVLVGATILLLGVTIAVLGARNK